MEKTNITKPANVKQTTKILEQMKNCICKILISGKENGTGFFTTFSYKNKNYPVLITNYHIIDNEYIKQNNSIKISFNDDQDSKSLLLNNDRIIYLSKIYDVTMIEIKERDNINSSNFLEIEDSLFSKNSNIYYIGKSIYALQYKDVALVSHGMVKEINEHDIIHYCPTEPGSSGAPLLNLANNKVIGVHKQSSTNINFNKGTFLVYPITEFINTKIIDGKKVIETKDEKASNNNNRINNETNNNNQKKSEANYYNNQKRGNEDNYSNTQKNNEVYNNDDNIDSNKNENNNDENNHIKVNIENDSKNIHEITDKSNEIFITLKIEKKDVNNKNIYFLDNVGIYKDGKYHYNEHLKELNERNTELYINNVKYKYQKYFLAPKEGTYIVRLIIKTLLVDCSYMFGNCKFVTGVDLSNLDTQNVASMKRMFYDCVNITDINFSSIDTRNLTNMECMFGNCKNLQSIDLSPLDTRNVSNMKNLFHSCKQLQNIDLSTFNTEKTVSMQCMFYGCDNLLNVNISSFNTSNVTNMQSMFDGCYKLSDINVSLFDTEKVTNMEKMFNCCYNVITLDLSTFYFDNVTNINNFLYGCDKLKEVKTNKDSKEVIEKEVNPHNNVKITII